MPVQIVMDPSGDARFFFHEKDDAALARAEQRFKNVTRQGFTAARRVSSNSVAKIHSFDRLAEETLFFPRLAGG